MTNFTLGDFRALTKDLPDYAEIGIVSNHDIVLPIGVVEAAWQGGAPEAPFCITINVHKENEDD